MKDTSITILGTEYIIKVGNKEKYPILDDCDGYTDTTIKLIVIDSMEEGEKHINSKQDLQSYQRQVARHEILHAFLFESGLDCNSFSINAWATNEEIIDWFSIQFPKIKKAYKELGIEW